MNAQDLSCSILDINFSFGIERNMSQERSKRVLGKQKSPQT